MAAVTQKERSAKTARKRVALAEEELRLRVRPGTRQALADLIEWHGIEEQGEAMTLMIHHLHGLGPAGSAQFLAPPRHEYVIPENVSRKLKLAYQRESLKMGNAE